MNAMLDLPQAELDRSFSLLYCEIVLSTILDCYHLGEGNAKRFKTCGGGRPWNHTKTLTNRRKDAEMWVKCDRFENFLSIAGVEEADLPERLTIVMHGGQDEGVARLVVKLQNRRNKTHGQEKSK